MNLPTLTQIAKFAIAGFVSALFALPAQAHHSYAIYDIDNKIERVGILKEFNWVQPHITMVFESTCDDGRVETWDIVTKAIRLWERDGHVRDFAEIGETITILGWPARDGSGNMALSAITSEKVGFMEMRSVIRQQGARDNLPEVTISPDTCQSSAEES
ncbi:MAG: hypothetical protein HOL48_09930 [Porticoccaceae bacterium]|nr:hypothetical protein [Porticoccaceae bacterium]